ncbi:MAG: energy transducer TonB [Thiobacillus sp.]
MPVNASIEEPTIPPRMRRALAAAWISLGLHAALIALVQVVPPASLSLSAPAIEARLVSAPAALPAAKTPPAPEVKVPEKPLKAVPKLAPIKTPEALPVAEPPAPPPAEPEPEPPAAEAPPAAPADPLPAPVAASPSAPAPVATITSSVDLTFYTARDLDVQPRALREIVPDYPSDADRRRLSGKVRLQLELEADGRVSDIGIVSASPPGIFDESAIKAFREARFAPAQKGGRPVRARVVIEVLYDWEGRR